MIQRLASALAAVALLHEVELARTDARRLLDDCADALRLELDCPQQELTCVEREALQQVREQVESEQIDPVRLRETARAACRAMRFELD